MTVAHFQQARFLPALNIFQRMLLVDVFVHRDDVQFQRKCWENRNKIKIANEPGWMWLTVPVKDCPLGTLIGEAEIDYRTNWQRQMLRAIEFNYCRAPHFAEFWPKVNEIIERNFLLLVSLNYAFIGMFIGAWGLHKCSFPLASELKCCGDTDDILIAMCKKMKADVYLSGAEGRNYNRPERWAEAGIDLRYHDYVYPEYPQQHGPFLPWMCALDLLFNCGRGGRKILEIGIV